MSLNQHDLDALADRTLTHYDQRAEDFWHGTRDHDVRQNIDALLQAISATPPFAILDFGCGPGRDLASFRALGHQPIGLDGSPRFAAMAHAYSGCEVWTQSFLSLDLPAARFDGVFANASLFHVPAQEVPRVLRELYATLKPVGVLFSSNPRGDDEEGWSAGRYGAFHRPETWQRLVSAAGFQELAHYYRPPGLPRAQQPWFASVWRRQS